MRGLAGWEWHELKAVMRRVYDFVKKDEPVPDYLYYAVLDMCGWPRDTVVDAVLFGSEQMKLITVEETLLYNDTAELEKRQIFNYPTPSKVKAYHVKN
jgi:hypothetical protein